MTIFEYVMILFSVVISLGLAKVLETHAHLIKREGVTWSATYCGWLLVIVFTQIDIWASLWQVHENARWTALDIGLSLLAAVMLFYAAIFATPEPAEGEPVDLWSFHLANRRRYLTALVGYMLIGTWLNATLMQHTFSLANLTATGPAASLMLLAILVGNRWVQRLAVGAVLTLQIIYFAQFLPAIGN